MGLLPRRNQATVVDSHGDGGEERGTHELEIANGFRLQTQGRRSRASCWGTILLHPGLEDAKSHGASQDGFFEDTSEGPQMEVLRAVGGPREVLLRRGRQGSPSRGC